MNLKITEKKGTPWRLQACAGAIPVQDTTKVQGNTSHQECCYMGSWGYFLLLRRTPVPREQQSLSCELFLQHPPAKGCVGTKVCREVQCVDMLLLNCITQ